MKIQTERKSVMGPDGCRTLISDEGRLAAGVAVCAVLAALRMFYGFCEAAGDEEGYDIEGTKAAFAANKLLSGILIGCIFMDSFIAPLVTGAGGLSPLVIAILVIAVFIVMFILGFFCGELPKRIMKGKRAKAFCSSGLVKDMVRLLVILTFPVATPASRLASLLVKDSGEDTVTEEEILMMVDAGNETGVIEESEKEMINNVFEFGDLTASDIMTHRTDVVGVESTAAVPEVVNTAISSGFSRLPVYENSIDHIVGMICVKDLLCMVGSEAAGTMGAKDFIRDIIYVPETIPCGELFKQLTENKMQMAAVADEYGGTAGIVTMEDVVEAVFGSIQDEYDDEAEEIVKISDSTYTIDGTAEPVHILKQLGITLPKDSDFDTMSGFIVSLLGRIPEENENPSVTYENTVFTVLITEDMRITRLKAELSEESGGKKDEEKNPKENDDEEKN